MADRTLPALALCRHCSLRIVHNEADGWFEPPSDGSAGITCERNAAGHEPDNQLLEHLKNPARCVCSKFARENGLIARHCPQHSPLSDAQRDALLRHGYNPDHSPRGVSGPPDMAFKTREGIWIRNRVCELDGVEIDGHEFSDLDMIDADSSCLHCRTTVAEIEAKIDAEDKGS